MDHFAGLDVSVRETSVCIVDETGKIVREVKVASEPDALVEVLTSPPTTSSGLAADRIGGGSPHKVLVFLTIALRHRVQSFNNVI